MPCQVLVCVTAPQSQYWAEAGAVKGARREAQASWPGGPGAGLEVERAAAADVQVVDQVLHGRAAHLLAHRAQAAAQVLRRQPPARARCAVTLAPVGGNFARSLSNAALPKWLSHQPSLCKIPGPGGAAGAPHTWPYGTRALGMMLGRAGQRTPQQAAQWGLEPGAGGSPGGAPVAIGVQRLKHGLQVPDVGPAEVLGNQVEQRTLQAAAARECHQALHHDRVQAAVGRCVQHADPRVRLYAHAPRPSLRAPAGALPAGRALHAPRARQGRARRQGSQCRGALASASRANQTRRHADMEALLMGSAARGQR